MSRSYLVAPRAAIYTGAALVAALGLFAMPAHAAEPTSATKAISINVDPVVNLTSQGDSYKATANVTVQSTEANGFRLTMAASGQDLVNVANDKYKITAVSEGKPAKLSANQWGYAFNQAATEFSQVPTAAHSLQLANVLPNNLDGCASISECTKSVTFAANIDNTTLPAGRYSTQVVYTVTPKLAPKPPVVSKSICRAGAADNDCKVDIDPDMVPVKYISKTDKKGQETGKAELLSVADPEAADSGWYNYASKQWANAVTVKKEAYVKYKGKSEPIDPADVLGYWVYIPRYAYEVMRRDYTDKLVKAQNFNVHFEKATDPKRIPAACPNQGSDYRTECGLNRDYIDGKPSNQGTWATHPAFTFGKKELNGIWFAKFQTTGDLKQPTVLPKLPQLSGATEGVDSADAPMEFYAAAKSLGVADVANMAGGTPLATQNSHNLARYSSRMVNNKDWSAMAYLTASQYGVGNNGGRKVGTTTYKTKKTKDRYKLYITGCGRSIDSVATRETKADKFDTSKVCNGAEYDYDNRGRSTSTTGTVSGVYDTASDHAKAFVAAGYSDDLVHAMGEAKIDVRYANLYNFSEFKQCTWLTCGGQALHEVNLYHYKESGSQSKDGTGQWLSDKGSKFVSAKEPWFNRYRLFDAEPVAGMPIKPADSKKDDRYMYSFRVVLGDFRQ